MEREEEAPAAREAEGGALVLEHQLCRRRRRRRGVGGCLEVFVQHGHVERVLQSLSALSARRGHPEYSAWAARQEAGRVVGRVRLRPEVQGRLGEGCLTRRHARRGGQNMWGYWLRLVGVSTIPGPSSARSATSWRWRSEFVFVLIIYFFAEPDTFP